MKHNFWNSSILVVFCLLHSGWFHWVIFSYFPLTQWNTIMHNTTVRFFFTSDVSVEHLWVRCLSQRYFIGGMIELCFFSTQICPAAAELGLSLLEIQITATTVWDLRHNKLFTLWFQISETKHKMILCSLDIFGIPFIQFSPHPSLLIKMVFII